MTAPNEGAAPVLVVDDLTVEFATTERTVEAIRGVGFSVGAGETVALVGESGSGKSVTALSVMRLVEHGGGRITRGRIEFARPDGTRLDLVQADGATMRAIRGAEIAMIFQEPMTSLNPVFTVGEQIAESVRLHQGKDRATALRRGAADAGARAHPRGRARAGPLSAPALRRHAAARDDRHGARLPAAAPDRRRADDGARRDHPGADPRPSSGCCRTNSAWR